MKKILLICALGILAQRNGYAQSVKLEDTVVSETNFETNILEVAKNVTIITKEEIAESGSKTLGEVLRRVPSLTVKNLGGADSTFDLRGQGDTAASNVLVLLDGTPLNTIDMAGYKTSQIDISSISRIEVIPSGGSVLYGDGAVGGVINIITDSPLNKKNYGTVAVEAGSYDYSKIYGSYGTAVTEDLLIKTSYSSKNKKGYRDETKDDLDDFEVSGKYLLTDGALSLGINHSKNKFSAPGALSEKDYHSNPTDTGGQVLIGENTETLYYMNFNKKLTQDLEFLVYGNYKEQKYRSMREYEFTPNWNYTRDTDTSTGYIKPHVKYKYFSDAYMILGMDFYKGKTEVKNTGKSEKDSTGFFGINKFTTNNWEFTQGYRRQFIEYDYIESKVNKIKKINEDAIDLSANYKFNDSS
ncbi:MAG: TonB-dependent receptor plug domain-containing protein, partial [Fusobacteriaceae bacterium]